MRGLERDTFLSMRTALALLVAVLSVAGCSSSSGSSSTASTGSDGGTSGGGALPSDIGGSQAVCSGLNGGTPDPQACIDCEVAHCKAQAQTVYGTDPKQFGGACQAMFSCLCACAANDSQCSFGCFNTATDACKAATQAMGDCVTANCSMQCPNN